jgi:hypothetical protein
MLSARCFFFVFLILLPAVAVGAGPRILLEKDALDFGKVQHGDKVQQTISVTNAGDGTLVIEKARASCDCTSATAASEQVPPNGKTELAVVFNSEGQKGGKKTQTVYIHTNDPNNSVARFEVRAEVLRAISVEPSTLARTLPRFQEKMTFPLTVKNTSPEPVTMRIAKVRGALAAASLTPQALKIDPGTEKSFVLEVQLVNQGAERFYTGGILIETDHPKEKQIALSCVVKIGQSQ